MSVIEPIKTKFVAPKATYSKVNSLDSTSGRLFCVKLGSQTIAWCSTEIDAACMVDKLNQAFEPAIIFEEFPKVYKSSNGSDSFLSVIYRDRSELYKLISRANEGTLQQQDKSLHYDPYSEEEMELGNGAQRVHCSKETKYVFTQKRRN